MPGVTMEGSGVTPDNNLKNDFLGHCDQCPNRKINKKNIGEITTYWKYFSNGVICDIIKWSKSKNCDWDTVTSVPVSHIFIMKMFGLFPRYQTHGAQLHLFQSLSIP